jgi:hypothetical protein
MKSGIQYLQNYLIRIISGLTVLIIWFFLQRSITKWMKRKKKILVRVSLAGLIPAVFTPKFQLPDFLAFISDNEVRLPHNIR